MEVLADQLDNTGDIGGIYAGLFGLPHHVDYTGKAHLVYHGPHRVLDLHGKGFVVGLQRLFRIQLIVLRSLVDAAHMVAARLGIVDYHTVTAYQPVDQRLDVHRTESHLAVADDDAGLNDVARHDLGLQAGVDYLDIHAAFCELATLKVHSLHILKDGKDDTRNIKVVNAPVAVA